MINSTVTQLEKLSALYGREVTLENVDYENGMRVLRVHIREGNRFTVMDINETVASQWGEVMCTWASQAPEQGN